jgi:hypothetical protein
MKIIFLDIDGVLNSETDFLETAIKYDPVHSNLQKGERWKIISAGKLALLNQIIRETDAKIVLSSTWRWKCDGKKMTKIFQRYGDIWEHDESIFVGKTPDYRRMGECHTTYRQMEIEAYIKEHSVDNYIILDDCGLINLPYHDRDDRFIKTSEYCGLTKLHMNRAMILLGRTEKYQKKFDKQQAFLRAMF